MKKDKNQNQKPLTLKILAAYNQEVLFPYLEERFVSKNEFNDFKNESNDFRNEMTDFKNEMTDFKNEMTGFKDEMTGFKNEMTDFKDEMTGFKDESLTGQDKILKKLDILLDEKDVKDYQDKKQKKVLAIHNKALKEHKILSPEELEEIAKLEIF